MLQLFSRTRLFLAIMISRNDTYEIDKVRWWIFVYAWWKLFNTIMVIIWSFFWMMDEMGWYDELVMVYVIGSINSRLLRLLFCCFVFVCILFVVGCFDFVIVVMIYSIDYFIIYCIVCVVLFFSFVVCCYEFVDYVII